MTNIIDLFLTLVQIDSPTGEESAVREFIAHFLSERHIESVADEHGNLIAKIPGEGEPLLLSAHMDTVEPGRGIKPHVTDDGYIVSDGSTILGADNKAALACLLKLINDIHDLPHRSLEFVFTTSEETGISGASQLDYSHIMSKAGYCFDLSQPLGQIVTASPFYERFQITLTGKGAHASRPEEGNNVLPALAQILTITKYGSIDGAFFNIGLLQAGDATNTVPGNAVLVGEIRSVTYDKIELLKKKLGSLLDEVSSTFGIQISQNWRLENPGYQHTSSKAKAFINETNRQMRIVGIETVSTDAGGVSDANEFNAHGILTLNLSDGTEEVHTREEKIKGEALEHLYALMKELTCIDEPEKGDKKL